MVNGVAFHGIVERLCVEHNITITQLATLVGLSTGAPTYWKRGTTPTSATILRIANHFGVSEKYLLTGNESLRTAPKKLDSIPLTEHLLTALETAQRDNAEKTATINKLVENNTRLLENNTKLVNNNTKLVDKHINSSEIAHKKTPPKRPKIG